VSDPFAAAELRLGSVGEGAAYRRADDEPGRLVTAADPAELGVWRLLSTFGTPSDEPPVGIYLIGMDPGGGPDDLPAFTRHYEDVHVPEVFETWGYERAARFELVTGPAGSPRFLAVYAAGADRIDDVRERRTRAASGPAPVRAPGPVAWQERTTRWRRLYEREAA
jgi:hypothetical protein